MLELILVGPVKRVRVGTKVLARAFFGAQRFLHDGLNRPPPMSASVTMFSSGTLPLRRPSIPKIDMDSSRGGRTVVNLGDVA